MPILTACRVCAWRFPASDEAIGKTVECPRCRSLVPVTGERVVDPAPEPADVELLRSIRVAVWINAWFLIAALALQLVVWLVSISTRPSGHW